MKKIDLYLIRAFVGPFLAILFVVIFILLLQFLWLYIDELVGKGLNLKIILEFLVWGATTMLPLSLPLATVLASVMTMGSFAENSELIALKSAGISLSRILAPLIVVSGLISIGAFFAANNLLPIAYNNIYTLREDILKTKEEIKIPTKTFYSGIDGYVLRVESTNRKTGMMYEVMVYNHSSGKGNTSLAMADSALLKMSDTKTFLTFAMYNGINYEETNSNSGRDTVRQVQRTTFTKQELIIPLEHYKFEKSKTGRYSDQAKSMSLGDLVEDQDSIRNNLNEKRRGQYTSLRNDRLLRFNYQMDSSYRASHGSVFDEGILTPLTLDKEIDAHTKAENALNSMISTLLSFDRETANPSFMLKLIDIEIFKKFSLALVCFLLFFIGAPIGALIRKGGLGTPAIISVLFFVLYYIIDIVGTKLARDGAINPLHGAFIASYVLLPIGAWLTWRAVNDESVFDNDLIRTIFRKTKRFVMGIFHKTSIIYMGTPEFAVAPLRELLDAGYKVSAVVTVPDKPSGRGLGVNESAVKKFAVGKGLPVLQPDNLKDPEFIDKLKSYRPDIFVVVAFRLLPREVFSIPSKGCFNLHAALLPQYRGAAPINWAVINGEKITGVTAFLIDEGVDTGTVITREQYRIKESDNAGDVHDALMQMGAKVVVQTVEALEEGRHDARVQKSFIQGEEILHKAPKLSRELCDIDWNDKVASVVNLVRGLSPYPGAFTHIEGNGKSLTLKVFAARKSDKPLDGAPAGSIWSDNRKELLVACADGYARLDEIQLEGKKRMNAEDFLRGFHDADSYKAACGTSREVIAAVHASEKTE